MTIIVIVESNTNQTQRGGQYMSKNGKKNIIVRAWDKLMGSNVLPIIWGTMTITIITAALLSVGIISIRWLLTLVGVI